MIVRAVVSLCLVPACAVAAAASTSAGSRTVRCQEIILPVGSGRAGGYRTVLGAVSVPQAYRPTVAPTGSPSWPYFSKAGLVVRAGRGPRVTVSVPRPWRNRLGISWGNGNGAVAAFSTVHVLRCPPFAPPKRWNAYAGGFYLRSRSACVPLVVRVGARSATVRFGLGRRCRG